MSQYQRVLLHAIICTLLLSAVLAVFVLVNYIDFSIIRIIYLPMYAIVIVAILFRQYLFGYIFTISAGLGLIVEYLIRSEQAFPTMGPAFANTLILFLGLLIGVIAQIIFRISQTAKKTDPGINP